MVPEENIPPTFTSIREENEAEDNIPPTFTSIREANKAAAADMPGSMNTQDEDMPGKTVPASKEIAQQTISRVITDTIAKVEELEKKKATETSPTKEEALEKEISKGKELLTGAMVVGLAAANKLTAP